MSKTKDKFESIDLDKLEAVNGGLFGGPGLFGGGGLLGRWRANAGGAGAQAGAGASGCSSCCSGGSCG
jgi:hypothetical protein